MEAGHRLHRPSAATPAEILTLMRDCTQLDVSSRPSMLMVQATLSGLCHRLFAGHGLVVAAGEWDPGETGNAFS